MRLTNMRIAIVTVILVGALAACGSDASSTDQESQSAGKVTVAIGAQGIFDLLPAEVGVEAGVWEELGLDVENIYTESGGQSLQLVAADNADIAVTGAASSAAAMAGGLEAKIVGGISTDFANLVMVGDLEESSVSPDDLNGWTIGIPGPGGVTDWAIDKMVQEYKLDGVKKAFLGDVSSLAAALRSGDIEAFIWTSSGGFQLQNQNEGKILFDFGFIENNVYDAIVAGDAAISSNSKAVQTYIDGWFATVQWMNEHKDETVQISVDAFGWSPKLAEQVYDASIATLNTEGQIPKSNLDELAESVAALKGTDIDVAQIYTPEFVGVSDQ